MLYAVHSNFNECFSSPSVFCRLQDLSFGLAKQLDHYNRSRKEAGLPTPQDHFKKHLFRQPTLTGDTPHCLCTLRKSASYCIAITASPSSRPC